MNDPAEADGEDGSKNRHTDNSADFGGSAFFAFGGVDIGVAHVAHHHAETDSLNDGKGLQMEGGDDEPFPQVADSPASHESADDHQNCDSSESKKNRHLLHSILLRTKI